MEVKFDSGFAEALSWSSGFFWLIEQVHARIVGRWTIRDNTVEHKNFGRSEDSLSTLGRRHVVDFSDLLETIITIGGGTLKIISPNGNVEREIENIPFLWFKDKAIARAFESVGVYSAEEVVAVSATEV